MSGEELRVLAEEQAALRRVATLVAHGVPQEELFAAVTEESGRLLPVEYAYLGRYLMLYADAMSKTLLLRTAPKPWGPFSKPVIAGGLPHQANENLVSVCFQHSQFSRDEGRSIVLSYSQPQFVQNTFVSITFD